MRDYTLCEVAYLNDAVTDIENTRRILLTYGLSAVPLSNSKGVREKNIVDIYHSFGNITSFDEAMHYLFDTLLQTAIFPECSTQRYNLAQLAWIGNVVLYPDNIKRELLVLGYTTEAAIAVANAARSAGCNVASWWIRVLPEHKYAAQAYLDSVIVGHTPGWPHHVAQPLHAST